MNPPKVQIRRLSTGVPGLDEVLGGGLPEYSFNLLAGAPGCGKTTLAHQLMFALATPEKPAIYFTVLGEPPVKMLRYQQQFEFFDLDRVGTAVRFVNLSDDTATGDLVRVLDRIVAEVEAHAPAFVFVDSFRSVLQASQDGAGAAIRLQQFIQALGVRMTSWQATTFLLGEYVEEVEPNPVFTVADGILWLRQSVERNSVVRKMEVVKMRGQRTLPGLQTFRISDAGITVFAPTPHPNVQPALPHTGELVRLTTGVPTLDTMLGGGLPRGYSLLVSGPSGSGKSLLAAAFLVSGAAVGETGVIAAFEQHPCRSRAPGLQALIQADRIGVIETGGTPLSVDEVSTLLVQEVRRRKATRVVIDSLSGFELGLAPTFRADFRESLARMLFALASTGVTVLMTSELEDRYGELCFSPYGTAFLADAIVMQRYTEMESRLVRVMAVVKVRGSAHSNELRAYRIGDAGIEAEAMIPGWDGLLSGRAARS